MVSTEDKYVIVVEATAAQTNLKNLQDKIQRIYQGMAQLTSATMNTTNGIARYTYEVTKAKTKVDQLANANRKLINSVTGVNDATSKYVRGKVKKESPIPLIPSASTINPYAGLPHGITKLPPSITKSMPLPTTMAGVGGGVKAPSTAMPPYINPSNFNIQPQTFGIPSGTSTVLNNLFPASNQIATQNSRINAMLNQINKPKAPPQPVTNTAAIFKNLGIQSIAPGASQFIPKKKAMQKEAPLIERVNTGFQKLQRTNFQLQMSSLGVVFSFMGLENTAGRLFSSLGDLGGNLKAGALGKAFTGIDIGAIIGVDSKQMVEAWKAFMGITSLIQALIAGLASKVLTPEIVAAITSVIAAIATELGKPEVVKAIREIIIAVLELAIELIKLIPAIVLLINWLGDTGLLKYFIMIIGVATILLPLLSMVGFAFGLISPILTILGMVSAAAAVVILIVIGIIAFLTLVFVEFSKTGDILKAVLFSIIDIIGVFADTIGNLMNLLIGWIPGVGKAYKTGDFTSALKNSLGGYPTQTTTAATTQTGVTNQYIFNGQYDVNSAVTALQNAKTANRG